MDGKPEAEVLYAFCVSRIEETKVGFNNLLNTNKNHIDGRLDHLLNVHLTKPGLIGAGEECPYKSLVDYLETKMKSNEGQ